MRTVSWKNLCSQNPNSRKMLIGISLTASSALQSPLKYTLSNYIPHYISKALWQLMKV